MNLLLVLFTLVGVTQVLHQPQLVVQAAAYGPHPELLSHSKLIATSKFNSILLIIVPRALVDFSFSIVSAIRPFPTFCVTVFCLPKWHR